MIQHLGNLIYTNQRFGILLQMIQHLAYLILMNQHLGTLLQMIQHLSNLIHSNQHLATLLQMIQHLAYLIHTNQHLGTLLQMIKHLGNLIQINQHPTPDDWAFFWISSKLNSVWADIYFGMNVLVPKMCCAKNYFAAACESRCFKRILYMKLVYTSKYKVPFVFLVGSLVGWMDGWLVPLLSTHRRPQNIKCHFKLIGVPRYHLPLWVFPSSCLYVILFWYFLINFPLLSISLWLYLSIYS